MENKELTMEEMNFMMGGNDSLNQIISLATNLYEQGYTKDEILNALSKKFDLENPIITDTLNSIYEKYNKDVETISKKI